MSRGPGKVEQAVERTFKRLADQSLSTEELCEHVYPDTYIEKRHRVSVLRAAKKVAARMHWDFGPITRATLSGEHGLVFYNKLDLQSYALARMRMHFGWGNQEAALEWLQKPDTRDYAHIQPGGIYWLHVERWKAEAEGDLERAAQMKELTEAALSERAQRIRGALSSMQGTRQDA